MKIFTCGYNQMAWVVGNVLSYIENWKFLIDQGNVMPCITINIQLEHYVYVFFVYWKF